MRHHLENKPIEGNLKAARVGFPLTPILIIKNNVKYICVFSGITLLKGGFRRNRKSFAVRFLSEKLINIFFINQFRNITLYNINDGKRFGVLKV